MCGQSSAPGTSRTENLTVLPSGAVSCSTSGADCRMLLMETSNSLLTAGKRRHRAGDRSAGRLMPAGAPHRLMDSGDQVQEGDPAGQVDPHRQVIGQQPDDRLELGPFAIAVDATDDRLLRKVRTQRRQHHRAERARQGYPQGAGDLLESADLACGDRRIFPAGHDLRAVLPFALHRQRRGLTRKHAAPVGHRVIRQAELPFPPRVVSDLDLRARPAAAVPGAACSRRGSSGHGTRPWLTTRRRLHDART